jgi:hypothetical protein
MLDKFYGWREWGEAYPWRWGFEEIKEKRYGGIRTPRQAIKAISACMQFVVEQRRKDPDFEPPEAFFALMAQIKPLMDRLRPIVEARLQVIVSGNILSNP